MINKVKNICNLKVKFLKVKNKNKEERELLCVVVHTFNPNTWEAEGD